MWANRGKEDWRIRKQSQVETKVKWECNEWEVTWISDRGSCIHHEILSSKLWSVSHPIQHWSLRTGHISPNVQDPLWSTTWFLPLWPTWWCPFVHQPLLVSNTRTFQSTPFLKLFILKLLSFQRLHCKHHWDLWLFVLWGRFNSFFPSLFLSLSPSLVWSLIN